MKPQCKALICDPGGYRCQVCNRPATYMVPDYGPRCGLHSRKAYLKSRRKLISADERREKGTK